MNAVRHRTIPVLSIVLVLILSGVARGDTAYTNTPAVSATAMPYGGTVVTEDSQAPVTPLLVEAESFAGANSGWAQAVPGRLRARSAISNAPEGWNNSQGVALFADHYHLDNPNMPANTKGVFFFRFFLTGTMRILASDLESAALVNLGGSAISGGGGAGQVNFDRVDGVPTLYAVSGGSGNPGDNILAGPAGEMKVFATTTTVTDGFYEVQIGIPVVFVFTNMFINRTPQVDDWQNQMDMRMSAVSFKNATCDFSSTFEFSPQNPIVPDPDDPALPTLGWDFGTASDETLLPTPLAVATSTGSGEAAFLAEQGTIGGLTARTLGDFPGGLSGGNFTHGWFAMDINLLDGGDVLEVAVTLPAAVGVGATWWFHDGAEWQDIALDDDDGDDRLLLQVTDNGFGDVDPTVGLVTLAGGISNTMPVPSLLSAFQAAWRSGAVELSWCAPSVDPALLRLEAHLSGENWLVPLTVDARGDFMARDDAEALFGGGTVRYDLCLDDKVMDSRTVELPPLTAARLTAVAPNPFNPRVEIAYTVARGAGSLELAIHDVLGRRVATLVSGDPGPGAHVAVWQGMGAGGRAMPSGTYLVRLATAQKVETRKISLVR